MIEYIPHIVFAIVCLMVWAIYGVDGPDPLTDTNKGDHTPLEDLVDMHSLAAGECHAVLIRQSGNEYRDLGVLPSGDAALAEVAKSFRRAKVDSVRITHSDANSLAVYRSVHNFYGRAEGKKLAGARLRLLSDEEA